jgi:hypothetical protein
MAPIQEYLNKYTKTTIKSLDIVFSACNAHVMDCPLNDALFNLLYSLTTFIMKNGHTTFNFYVNTAAHGGHAFNNRVLFWWNLFKGICLTDTCIKDSKEINTPQCYIIHTFSTLFTSQDRPACSTYSNRCERHHLESCKQSNSP